MSYDPYASGSDEPRPGDPYDYERPSAGAADPIKGRVQAPAIALIVVGILNLLGALYLVFNTLYLTVIPANDLKSRQSAMYESVFPAMKAQLDNTSADEMKRQALMIYWPLTFFALLTSVLPIAGGIRMLSLKSYPLGVCAAVSAAIPCISPTACCGIGEIVGIWALIVLINENVRAAFR
jgi:hypothetical protein